MLRKKLYNSQTQSSKPASSTTPSDIQQTALFDPAVINSPSQGISKYFPNDEQSPLIMQPFTKQVLDVQRNLSNRLNQHNFLKLPVQYVYNPLDYAKAPNELYFTKYCQSPKKLLFVGMNPGPFGMCQTGVPFGDTSRVREWLQIEGEVSKPPNECPFRPVQGFDCVRKEQSGDRFWKFWESQCGAAENFFKNAFVYNYCPLAFMDRQGRNVTPADLKECKELESICDEYYSEIINLMEPNFLIAIGRYIEKRTHILFKQTGSKIPILCMPHPSPRTINNQNWPEKALQFLEKNNLKKYFELE
ncbi:single-strand selective monofunctional uracil DNA glycosylase [Euwallacea similis]|uniref:single-strand selective monofunctional uracil DNA glycosylase n=1 Tax=Euwallacea similis TaxID=1736056 RepID=UPI0034508B61